MGSSGDDNVNVNLNVFGEPEARAAFKSLNVEVNQFTQNVEQGSARAGAVWGNFIERFAVRRLLLAAVRDVEDFFASSIKGAQEAERAEAAFNSQILATEQSYRAARAAREDFRALTGATGAQAGEATTAAAAVAFRSGLTSENDARIQRAVADMVASRGGGSAEAVKALEKLQAGNAEVVRELTGKTSDEVERAYALLHDKLPKDLLPFEKSLAQVNAVVDHSKLFTGEAASHLDTLSGKIEQSTNKWEDYKAGIGEAILSSAQLKDVLDSLLLLTGRLPGATSKGFRDVREAGRQAEEDLSSSFGGGLKSIFNRVELGAKSSFVTLGSIFSGDILTARGRAGLDLSEQYRDEILNRDRINAEEIQAGQNKQSINEQVRRLKLGGVSQQEIGELFKNSQRFGGAVREQFIEDGIEKLLKGVEEKRVANEKAQQQQERDIQLQKSRFERRIAEANKVEDLSSRIRQLGGLRSEVDELPSNVYDANDKEAIAARIEADTQAAADALASAVKTTRDAARSLFADATIKSDRDNPFVALFVRGRLEIEETRKTFRAFGDDFAEQMVRIKQAEIEQDAAVLRLQTRLSSLRAEQEARRLERGEGLALTGPEERALAVRNAQAAVAVNVPQLLAEAAGLRGGRALGSIGDLNSLLSQEAQARLALQFERDPARRAELQAQGRDAERQFRSPATDLRPLQVLFEELRRLEALRTEGGGRLGDQTRDALNQQLLRLTGQIDPRVLATDARFAGVRDLRARTLDEEAQRFERDVRDQRAREEVGNLAQRDAGELLQAVSRASGVGRDEQLKQFLAVTGALGEKELTPDLRQSRIGFLREGASRDASREQRADQLTAALVGGDGKGGILGRLDGIITRNGIKLDGETAKIRIDVSDPSGRANVTGPGF
jgi:hypothetical protein